MSTALPSACSVMILCVFVSSTYPQAKYPWPRIKLIFNVSACSKASAKTPSLLTWAHAISVFGPVLVSPRPFPATTGQSPRNSPVSSCTLKLPHAWPTSPSWPLPTTPPTVLSKAWVPAFPRPWPADSFPFGECGSPSSPTESCDCWGRSGRILLLKTS